MAREAGTGVVTPEQARQILDQEIASSDTGLFANSDGEQLADQLSAEREAATQPDRPEWHELWRPRELTPPEYQARFVDPYEHRDELDEPDIVIPAPASAPARSGTPAKRGGCAVVALMASDLLVGIAELMRQIAG